MRISNWIVGASLVFAMHAGARAEGPPEPPKPTAEHKELAMWVGKWTGKAEMKPGPFGPGGPMTWTEDCSWFGGGEFTVVCKSEGTGPMGPMKGLGIVGYNVEKKVYTHYGVDSNGWAGLSEGTRSGDSWTYRSQESMGGKTVHTRWTMTKKSPTQIAFTWEMSEDGSSWATMMEGTSEKK